MIISLGSNGRIVQMALFANKLRAVGFTRQADDLNFENNIIPKFKPVYSQNIVWRSSISACSNLILKIS